MRHLLLVAALLGGCAQAYSNHRYEPHTTELAGGLPPLTEQAMLVVEGDLPTLLREGRYLGGLKTHDRDRARVARTAAKYGATHTIKTDLAFTTGGQATEGGVSAAASMSRTKTRWALIRVELLDWESLPQSLRPHDQKGTARRAADGKWRVPEGCALTRRDEHDRWQAHKAWIDCPRAGRQEVDTHTLAPLGPWVK